MSVSADPNKREGKVGKWYVAISPSKCYGYFEHDEEGEGGGLWFDGDKRLIDYDGVFMLPHDVAAAIRQAGYIVPTDCDPVEQMRRLESAK